MHLFLLKTTELNITGLTPFYHLVLDVWKTLRIFHDPDPRPRLWLFEEPLFHNDLVVRDCLLSSPTIRTKFIQAGIEKLGHLTRLLIERIYNIANIKSIRILKKVLEEVWATCDTVFADNRDLADQWHDGYEYMFPVLSAAPAFDN